MAGPNDGRPDGGPHHIHVEKNQKKKKSSWLPWLLLGLLLLGLLFALSRCGRDEEPAPPPPETAATAPAPAAGPGEVIGATPTAQASGALAGTAALGTYLAGTDAAPRNFLFDKLNFDTGKSDIRPQDRAEIDRVAAALKQYPSARVRIAGYADPRGDSAANAALGKARAESIKSALVTRGVNAANIETASGGENDPVDSNATASGRLENRRTELIVTAR